MKASALARNGGHLLLAAGVSGLLLALLIRAGADSAGEPFFPRLLAVLRGVAVLPLLLYVAAALARTALQTLRYRLILNSGEAELPGFFQLFLATMSRNMFVDMLPARLGELSFAAMLNRGHRVPVAACLSALALAFLFDLAALAAIIALVFCVQLAGIDRSWWPALAALFVLGLFGAGLLLLFPGLGRFETWLNTWCDRLRRPSARRPVERALAFFRAFRQALDQARRAGIAGRIALLSLAVRAAKYLGLYCLFHALAAPNFPGVSVAPAPVLAALVTAEAGAALPVPAFMGFGAYEGGGVLALAVLGADKNAAFLIMLALHLWSQAVDYLLGGAAFIAFLVVGGNRALGETAAATRAGRRRAALYLACGLALCLAAALLLAREGREWRLRRAMTPPTHFGESLSAGRDAAPLASLLGGRSGFVVWSSNRSGNHALWRLDLLDGEPEQLTSGEHADYFPRISPDGGKVVFARSKASWCSHRDFLGWSVYLLDLQSGEERLLATDGNTPTWSNDGKHIFYQRHGNQFVRLNLKNGRETVLLESGKNIDLPPKTWLETPTLSPDGKWVAVTLRGARRSTAVVDLKAKSIRPTGGGCELAWAPDGRYLFKVDHGGKQHNAFYRLNAKTLEPVKWLDSPTEYSHEYFPKVANSGDVLVYGASTGDHEHDKADYEIFLWKIGWPPESAVRLTFHTGNDNWPDIFVQP